MDIIYKGLQQMLNVYQDNSELISTAVHQSRDVEKSGLATLKAGFAERRRKLILKAVTLLAPSDIPAKVLEVDGVDDAELVICQERGWLNTAFAIYLRQDDVSGALALGCTADLGHEIGYYAHSVLA